MGKKNKKKWLHSYSFYIKLLDGKGPFASNAFKNSARYKYLYKLTMFVWGWTEMIPNLLRNFIRVCLDLNLYTVCCGLCIEAGYDGGSLFLTLERGTNS